MRGLLLGIERSSLLVWSHPCASWTSTGEDRGLETGPRPMVVAEKASRTAEGDRDRLIGGLRGVSGGPVGLRSPFAYPVVATGRSALFP